MGRVVELLSKAVMLLSRRGIAFGDGDVGVSVVGVDHDLALAEVVEVFTEWNRGRRGEQVASLDWVYGRRWGTDRSREGLSLRCGDGLLLLDWNCAAVDLGSLVGVPVVDLWRSPLLDGLIPSLEMRHSREGGCVCEEWKKGDDCRCGQTETNHDSRGSEEREKKQDWVEKRVTVALFQKERNDCDTVLKEGNEKEGGACKAGRREGANKQSRWKKKRESHHPNGGGLPMTFLGRPTERNNAVRRGGAESTASEVGTGRAW